MKTLILTLVLLASTLSAHANNAHGTYGVAVQCESEGTIIYYYINEGEKKKIKQSVKGWVSFTKMYSIRVINEMQSSKETLTFLHLVSIKKARFKINFKKSTKWNIDPEVVVAEELKDFQLEVTEREMQANFDMDWVVTPSGLAKKSNGWKHGADYTCKLSPSFTSYYLN